MRNGKKKIKKKNCMAEARKSLKKDPGSNKICRGKNNLEQHITILFLEADVRYVASPQSCRLVSLKAVL